MSALTVVRQTSVPSAGSDGTKVPIRVNRRGEVVTMPWLISLALEGKLFTAYVGSISAPATFFGASQTALVLEDAEIAIRNVSGSGRVFMPVYIGIVFEAAAAATVNEVVFYSSNVDIGAGTSTTLAANPLTTVNGFVNNFVNGVRGNSAATVQSLYSAAGNTQSGVNEFYRSGYPSSNQDVTLAPRTLYEWSALQNGNAPLVTAPGTIAVAVGSGTAAGNTGFLVATWAEFSSDEIR